MSKLLFIYENNMPTVSIIKSVFMKLDKQYGIISDFILVCDVDSKTINNSDIVVLIRPTDIISLSVAKCARLSGRIVITFCDDDLLNLPQSIPSIPWRKNTLIRILNCSDAIWSTSPFILDKYCNLTDGKKKIRFDTIVREDEINGINVSHNNECIKIVYAAGGNHESFFYDYVKPIVPDLINKYGKSISFTFVGVHPEMDNIPCEYVSGMQLEEYREYMRNSKFDIGLSPLHDDDFSKCKYFNKYIEYTTQGIVGVYSNVKPFTYIVSDKENGFLADNTPESWLETLEIAIENKSLRETCLLNAIDNIKEVLSESSVIDRLKKDFPIVCEESKDYKDFGTLAFIRLKYKFTRVLDWMYLIGFYRKQNGLIDVLKRIYRKVFRLNAYSRK